MTPHEQAMHNLEIASRNLEMATWVLKGLVAFMVLFLIYMVIVHLRRR